MTRHTHTHTHTHTHFRVGIGKSRKPLEKNGWPEGRQSMRLNEDEKEAPPCSADAQPPAARSSHRSMLQRSGRAADPHTHTHETNHIYPTDRLCPAGIDELQVCTRMYTRRFTGL